MTPPPKVIIQSQYPDDDLLVDCSRTPISPITNGDLIRSIDIRDGDLDRCNARWVAIRTAKATAEAQKKAALDPVPPLK